ncbi:MAG: DUF47 family protein [Candidatus Nezhaarchaeota archaeon]|nr:DUF47 family protein [Candidatus Nezhaarchaeota archaeon]
MIRTTSLFAWLGRERERRVLGRAKEHMKYVVEVVRALREAAYAFCRGDREGVEKWFNEVFKAERKADELKRGIIEDMASQLFHPIDRDEITRLVLVIDDVASNAKGAGSRMMFMEPKVEDEDVANGLLKIADSLVTIAEEALNAVSLLVESPKEALKGADRVERLEEMIDDVRRELLKRILRMGDVLGPSRLVCLKEIVDSMENVADRCEDVADLVRSLAVLSA